MAPERAIQDGMLVLDAITRIFTLKILNLDRPNIRHKNVTRQTKIWGDTKLLGSLRERCENMAVRSIKIDL